MTDQPPRRVRIVSPKSGAPRARARRAVHDIAEQTGVGEVLMRSLVRAQLRLATGVLLALLVLLGGLPLLFALDRHLDSVHVVGVPLPWVLLGFVVYPLLIAGGWLYVRLAERNEREFSDLVERS